MLRCVDVTQTPLPGTETVLIGLVVTAVVVPAAAWELTKHFSVMAHEGMHAAAGSASGRKLHSLTLAQNGNGLTVVDGGPGPARLLFYFSGYLGPSVFGLGAARLIQFGHIIAVLWLTMLLLGLLLVAALRKRSFGWVTIPLAGFLLFLVLKHTPQTEQILAAYVITWFLLLSGVRQIVQHGASAVDAGKLNGHTNIPKQVWALLWVAGTVAAVVIGARWMLHPIVHLAAQR